MDEDAFRWNAAKDHFIPLNAPMSVATPYRAGVHGGAFTLYTGLHEERDSSRNTDLL